MSDTPPSPRRNGQHRNGQHRNGWIRRLPNLLSLLRLVLVPGVIALLLAGRVREAALLFVAAALLDAVDGWLARRLDARSLLGAYLDPAADKALAVGTGVAAGWLGWLPAWLVVLMVGRDVLIVSAVALSAAMAALRRCRLPAPRPLAVSKINTAAQGGLLAATIAAHGFGLNLMPLLPALIGLAAFTTVASGGAYVYVWWHRTISPARPPPDRA